RSPLTSYAPGIESLRNRINLGCALQTKLISAARPAILVGIVHGAAHTAARQHYSRCLQIIARNAQLLDFEDLFGDITVAANGQSANDVQTIAPVAQESLRRFQIADNVALGHILTTAGHNGGLN